MRLIFGSISIESEVCPRCGDRAFVIDGRLACCGVPPSARAVGQTRTRTKRVSISTRRRQRPSSEEQARILSRQRGRCMYCGSVFGDYAKRGREIRRLVPNWDHVEPFSWQSNNQPINFVAACSICNGIKSNLFFATIEEAIEHVWRRRKAKGWESATEEQPGSDVRQLWRTIPDCRDEEDVLLEPMPQPELGEESPEEG